MRRPVPAEAVGCADGPSPLTESPASAQSYGHRFECEPPRRVRVGSALVRPSGEPTAEEERMKVCIVGASGKLGHYMIDHCLDRGHEVVGVCREESVPKLDAYRERIAVIAGRTNDRDVIERAVAGCTGA